MASASKRSRAKNAAKPNNPPVWHDLTPADTLLSKEHGAGALSLDVVGYADERAADLNAVAALLGCGSGSRNTEPLASAVVHPVRQRERMLRRRGSSNTVWRWRTHLAVVPAKRVVLLGKSRRDRRRASQLRARTAQRGGLETETWHAKRFEMARLFGGLRLPWRARDRSAKAAVRAANEGCVLHDASYWRCVSLRCETLGPICTLLGRMSGAAPNALQRALESGREVHCLLHRIDARPTNALAPVRLLACRPSDHRSAAAAAGSRGVPTGCAAWAEGLSASGGGARPSATAATPPASTVWIFVHNAALAGTRAALIDATASLGTASPPVTVSHGPPLLRFELRGPTSHSVLARALHPAAGGADGADGASSSQQAAWAALAGLSSPAVLPSRVVLGLDVMHPYNAQHPKPPVRRAAADDRGGGGMNAAALPATSAQQAHALRALLTRWSPTLAASPLYARAGEAGSGSGDNGSGGNGGGGGGGSSSPLSVLLVQQPPASHASGSSGASGGFGSGWDVLVGAGSSAGRALWHALVLAGGRAIGQREKRLVALEEEQPLFPYDYPDTLSGLQTALAEAEERRLRHEAHPPARRPNHAAMCVDHPFAADWPALLGVPRTTLAQPPPPPPPLPPQPPTTMTATPSHGSREEAAAGEEAASAAPEPPVEPPSQPPVMQFGVLRGEHAAALAATDAPLPPLLRALAPRMLVRVTIHLCSKGCPHAPAAIHAPRVEDVSAWRHNQRWGGPAVPAGAGAAQLPAGGLLGYVTNGGYSLLRGGGMALGFIAAESFADMLRSGAAIASAANSGSTPPGAPDRGRSAAAAGKASVLVLVRNPSSRQFRPAQAFLRL